MISCAQSRLKKPGSLRGNSKNTSNALAQIISKEGKGRIFVQRMHLRWWLLRRLRNPSNRSQQPIIWSRRWLIREICNCTKNRLYLPWWKEIHNSWSKRCSRQILWTRKRRVSSRLWAMLMAARARCHQMCEALKRARSPPIHETGAWSRKRIVKTRPERNWKKKFPRSRRRPVHSPWYGTLRYFLLASPITKRRIISNPDWFRNLKGSNTRLNFNLDPVTQRV